MIAGNDYIRLTVAAAINTTNGARLTTFGSYPVPKFVATTPVYIGTGSFTFNIYPVGTITYADFRVWELTVQLWDEMGGTWGPYQTNMVINVVKSNDPPILTALAKSTPVFILPEDKQPGDDFAWNLLSSNYTINTEAPAQRLLLSISNATYVDASGNVTLLDATAFGVDICGGTLTLGVLPSPPRFGVSPNYTLWMHTCDSGTPVECVDWVVRVVVAEANRAPEAPNATVYLLVAENSRAGAPVTLDNGFSGAFAVDSNTPASPLSWRTLVYSIVLNAPGNIFAINATTGDVQVAPGSGGPTLLNFEDPNANSYLITLRASDVGE